MTTRSAPSSEPSMGRLSTEPASLQPYRSSAEVGWDGLYAAAFHVPRAVESE